MNASTEIIRDLLMRFEDDINAFKFDGIYEDIMYHEFQFEGITGKLTNFYLEQVLILLNILIKFFTELLWV